jgi:hypothetical protein
MDKLAKEVAKEQLGSVLLEPGWTEVDSILRKALVPAAA